MKTFIMIILVLAAYLCGSIPSALIIGKKFFNKDIRLEGSGNLGGTNAGRVLGNRVGIIVSIADILKVLIPTALARYFYGFDMASLIGIVAMVGHSYPIFAGFKGGKGVSSYLGIGIILNPLVSVIVFAIWFSLRKITNYVSLSSIIACSLAPIFIYFFHGIRPAFFIMLFGAVFIVFLHRANIKRLLNGTENKIKK